MNLRKLRLQRGWTQEQLAELTGLSVRSIQRIERGQKCSLEAQKALAAVFEVELSVFQPVDKQPGEDAMNSSTNSTAEEDAAIEYVKGLKEFYQHLLMYVIFAVALLVFRPEHPYVLWGLLGWGVGLALHGLNVYEVINFFGPGWERRRIEKRLGRKL